MNSPILNYMDVKRTSLVFLIIILVSVSLCHAIPLSSKNKNQVPTEPGYGTIQAEARDSNAKQLIAVKNALLTAETPQKVKWGAGDIVATQDTQTGLWSITYKVFNQDGTLSQDFVIKDVTSKPTMPKKKPEVMIAYTADAKYVFSNNKKGTTQSLSLEKSDNNSLTLERTEWNLSTVSGNTSFEFKSWVYSKDAAKTVTLRHQIVADGCVYDSSWKEFKGKAVLSLAANNNLTFATNLDFTLKDGSLISVSDNIVTAKNKKGVVIFSGDFAAMTHEKEMVKGAVDYTLDGFTITAHDSPFAGAFARDATIDVTKKNIKVSRITQMSVPITPALKVDIRQSQDGTYSVSIPNPPTRNSSYAQFSANQVINNVESCKNLVQETANKTSLTFYTADELKIVVESEVFATTPGVSYQTQSRNSCTIYDTSRQDPQHPDKPALLQRHLFSYQTGLYGNPSYFSEDWAVYSYAGKYASTSIWLTRNDYVNLGYQGSEPMYLSIDCNFKVNDKYNYLQGSGGSMSVDFDSRGVIKSVRTHSNAVISSLVKSNETWLLNITIDGSVTGIKVR